MTIISLPLCQCLYPSHFRFGGWQFIISCSRSSVNIPKARYSVRTVRGPSSSISGRKVICSRAERTVRWRYATSQRKCCSNSPCTKREAVGVTLVEIVCVPWYIMVRVHLLFFRMSINLSVSDWFFLRTRSERRFLADHHDYSVIMPHYKVLSWKLELLFF